MEGYRYSAKARAKINLSLDVGLRRPDGYHDLETVMHTVSLCDDIYMNLLPSGEIRVRSSIPGMPEDEKNLAGKAVLAFNAVTGRDTGAEIYIDKRIPSEAGLGGGSSDAGAVLRLLGEIFKTPTEQLLQAAVRVGADVPFTMTGGCALCRGIGERMEPLPAMPACRIVIVKPPVGAPTGAVFAAFDRDPVVRQDTADVTKALRNASLDGLCAALGNGLAKACFSAAPEAGEPVERMLSLGALGACLSGSGTASYGIFRDENKAAKAAESLAASGLRVFLTEPSV